MISRVGPPSITVVLLMVARTGSAQTEPPLPSTRGPAPAPPSAPAGSSAAATAPFGAADSVAPATALPSDPKAEAQAHFEQGKTLYKTGALSPALAEFLQSMKLFPTRSATNNAALCLTALQRFDEALETYERLIRDYPDLSESMKTPAQREIVRLRGLVGVIDIVGAPLGAAITMDGRSRGDYPPAGPLRVPAGSHVIRLYKEGFGPFEDRVDVGGGETARVLARLVALEQPGRLTVTEKRGRALDVVVDGSVVGKAPWSGSLAPGDHTVLLRGEEQLGTQPVAAPVKLGQTTSLSLEAEPLEGWLEVEPTPAGASVAIDSVTVGRGVWEGRLRVGSHRVEVLAEGFLASTEQVVLVREKRQEVQISLQRDLSSPMWRKPPKIALEADVAVPITPTFGGGVAGQCGDGCRADPGVGGQAVFRGGYELGSGLGLGVTAGYLNIWQSVANRTTTLDPVGPSELQGSASDTLNVRGVLVGAWASYVLGDRYTLRFRLGAGALIGSAADERVFESGSFRAGPVGLARPSTFVYVAPEVRAGYRLGKHIELTAGLEALVLISPSAPAWKGGDVPVDAHEEGIAYFDTADLTGSLMLVLAPGIGARYDF